jgi:hypothetical protein
MPPLSASDFGHGLRGPLLIIFSCDYISKSHDTMVDNFVGYSPHPSGSSSLRRKRRGVFPFHYTLHQRSRSSKWEI